jgi:hypothetical protein
MYCIASKRPLPSKPCPLNPKPKTQPTTTPPTTHHRHRACGAYPFRRAGDDVMRPNARNAALFERIRAVEYSFPEAAHFRGRAPPGESLKGLVRRMLVADPAQRATLAEVMQHPW